MSSNLGNRHRGSWPRAAAALVALCALVFALALPSSKAADSRVPAPERIYVMVVDGLRTGDVNPMLMPNITALRQQGTWYEQARALYPAETLPNHAAMMTGVLPYRSGIVGNKYLEESPSARANRAYNASPWMWQEDHLITRLERACGAELSSASALSKTYLDTAFSAETPVTPESQLAADFQWHPSPLIPVSDHAPDAATMNAFVPWAVNPQTKTPQFGFVNLGDVDRAGHADAGGEVILSGEPGDENAVRANDFHQAAMADTDTLIGDFVDQLKTNGWWDETVLILLSDHGMDWAPQDNRIDLEDRLQNTQRADGRANYRNEVDFVDVNNGAADSIYIKEQDPRERDKIINTIKSTPGVERVFTDDSDRTADERAAGPVPEHLRSEYGHDGPRSPDVMVFAKPGYSMSPATAGNPVPGNHGHPMTQHASLLVTGGHASLATAGPASTPSKSVPGSRDIWPIPDGHAPPRPQDGPGTLSIAPTLAYLTGLGNIEGGYQGQPLSEAFDPDALASGTTPLCAGIDPPLPPGARTDAASGVAADTATLNGLVDPKGQAATRYHFEYGPGTGYGREVPAGGEPLGGAANGERAVSQTPTDLAPDTTYHYRLVAVSPGGTTYGEDQTFTTAAPPPAPPLGAPGAKTTAPTSVTPSSAALNGIVNAKGRPETRWVFEYGTDTRYGHTAPSPEGAELGHQDRAEHTVSHIASDLVPQTTYHYRLVAGSPAGTATGDDMTFTTPAAPEPGGETQDGRVQASITRTRAKRYGRPFVLSGRVDGSEGCPLPGWVEVRRRPVGKKRLTALAQTPVLADGSWRVTLSARRTATYVAVPDGTLCAALASRPRKVAIRVAITLSQRTAASPSESGCEAVRAVAGRVRPAYPGTRMLLQRRRGARWRTVARTQLDGRSRFRLSTSGCRSAPYRVWWPKQSPANAATGRRL